MVSKAIAPRNAKKRPFVLKQGISMLSDLADGNAIHGYPGDYPGLIYYVNNITGSSAGDGLSWDTPFAEVSEAITASETFRQLPSGSTNDYVRNIIYVQGTGTNYAPLTALPSYCDLIGIGANPRGNGSGIVKIMDNNNTTDAIAASVRGLYMANFQVGDDVASGSTGYAMDLAVCYRSTFENCVFWNKLTGGVRLVSAGGVTFRNCHIGGGDTSYALIGLHQSGGDNFNNCLIEDCFIYGDTTGVSIAAEKANNTWFRNNYIYGGTTGYYDDGGSVDAPQFAITTDNYFLAGTTAYSVSSNGTLKAIGNISNSNGTTVWVAALA
jgi:hypothetical protein